MSLRTRVRALERRLRPPAPGPDAMPHLVTVSVNSKAPALNPGPIRWGTVPGVPKVFERGPDESEDDFVARLIALHPTPRERLTSITIHAETLKPEPPEMSS
jgi:hypothetical protein